MSRLEIACIIKFDENLAINLIKNQKLSYKQANSILKERYPGVQGFSPLEDFVAKGAYLQVWQLKKWLKWWRVLSAK